MSTSRAPARSIVAGLYVPITPKSVGANCVCRCSAGATHGRVPDIRHCSNVEHSMALARRMFHAVAASS